MPELSRKEIVNDIGKATVALHASAESVITNQLNSLKEQLMETREGVREQPPLPVFAEWCRNHLHLPGRGGISPQ